MPRLVERLSELFSRIEVHARGAEELRQQSETALSGRRYLEARNHARALLVRVPNSPHGLALWAEAAAGCFLGEEEVFALTELVAQVPWRYEAWLALGQAGVRHGSPDASAALQHAANASSPAIRREALLQLADLDIVKENHERALRWLDRVPQHESEVDLELKLRQAECFLATGHPERAASAASHIHAHRGDGRARLVKAQLAELFPERPVGGSALSLALGAFILGADGSADTLARVVANSDDAATLGRVRAVLKQAGQLQEPRWQASLAIADGDYARAREALLRGVDQNDHTAANTLLSLAESRGDFQALSELNRRAPQALSDSLRALLGVINEPGDHTEQDDVWDALDAAIADKATSTWAISATEHLLGTWFPPTVTHAADWDAIVFALNRKAQRLGRLDLMAAIEALSLERQHPLRVAVLGEFNAGKSTFINALLGADVAPTGVRPTTASLHWVAWAPDPFVRVVIKGKRDRVMPHETLKSELHELHRQNATIDHVVIYAPIERLKRMELLDTPGFNASEPDHAKHAHRGVQRAHAALWLLDANSPLKETERKVLEQLASTGVPLQILVNKCDRLSEDEISKVLEYLHDALQQIHIHSIARPLAFSAKLALAGRTGDSKALAISGWGTVQAQINETLVDQSAILKEGALRRKTIKITEQLLMESESNARKQAERRQKERDRLRDLRGLADELESDAEHLAASILNGLAEAREDLGEDLRPLERFDHAHKATDLAMHRYAANRTAAHLAAPTATLLAEQLKAPATEGQEHVSALLQPVCHAVILGAAAGGDPAASLDDKRLCETLLTCIHCAAKTLRESAPPLEPSTREDRLSQQLRLFLTTCQRSSGPPPSKNEPPQTSRHE